MEIMLPPKNPYKYTGQAQFFLGVAATKYQYGCIGWKQCAIFDYSEKTIVNMFKIDQYKINVVDEVKTLKTKLIKQKDGSSWAHGMF